MSSNQPSKYHIDDDLAFAELKKMVETKVCSDTLALIYLKLMNNMLENRSYAHLHENIKEDMRDMALMEFLKYGHNFKVDKCYSAKGAIGYLNFNMKNSFNKAITRFRKNVHNQEGICISDMLDIASMESFNYDID